MRNRDMPAGAIDLHKVRFEDAGLTKLEAAAIAAMQGLLSSWPADGALRGREVVTAKGAVAFAKALFDELDATEESDEPPIYLSPEARAALQSHINEAYKKMVDVAGEVGPHGWPADQCGLCGGPVNPGCATDDCPHGRPA